MPLTEAKAQRARPHRNIAGTLARWSARHRTIAIVGWLVLVAAVTVAGSTVGTRMLTDAELGTGDSGKAEQIIANAGFPDHAGELVLVQAEGEETADDQAFRQAVEEVIAAVAATGEVENIVSPYDETAGGAISPDGRSALVVFDMAGDPDTAAERVGTVLDATAAVQEAHPDLYIAQTGAASGEAAVGESLDEDFARLGMLSIPLTLGILLVAFGALVAAVLPVGLALTAIAGAIGLLALVSQIFPADDATAHIMLLIGLAVGVDYCMFYIRREREERAGGANPERALSIAAATSGRSVLISGLTVIAAMSGMFLAGDGIFTSFAVGTVLVVAVAVLGSVTVLPAALWYLPRWLRWIPDISHGENVPAADPVEPRRELTHVS